MTSLVRRWRTTAIIHGGPFANIAHGCNSAIATKLSLKLADYVITEAGFGADLGAEKFPGHQVPRGRAASRRCGAGCSVRALKSHGGVAKPDLSKPNADAVKAGAVNLARHIENLQGFGLPVWGINAFPPTPGDGRHLRRAPGRCALRVERGVAKGGEGGKAWPRPCC